MNRLVLTIACSVAIAVAAAAPLTPKSEGSSRVTTENVERGRYLVRVAGCGDCHTPGHLRGQPDLRRNLGGSDVGIEVPGLGTFFGPNLTPDLETGLGSWSDEQIIAAVTRGTRPDSRVLMPTMPWPAYSELKHEDAEAIVAYLRTLPAVKNRVPAPLKPGQPSGTFVFKLVAPSSVNGHSTPESR